MQEDYTAEEYVKKTEQKSKMVRRILLIKSIINYHIRRSPSTVTKIAVSGVFMLSIAKQVLSRV